MPAAVNTTACLDVRGLTYCQNNITQIFLDGKIRNTSDCSLKTCSLLLSHWNYLPNKPGNYLFAALFFLILLFNIPLGFRRKTWTILVAVTLGCAMEGVGTIGRIMAANDPFKFTPFLIYIIFLTIGPVFLSAVIYLCASRVIVVYGTENARLSPRLYSIIFMVSDFICLILQGTGGGLAASAENDKIKTQKGINVMRAGLVWQVASLTLFALAMADFAWRVRARKGISRYESLTGTSRFKGFLCALGIATAAIYIRSIYRVVELSEGFTGKLASLEIPYMLLEPTMIGIACICLTFWHPAIVFGDLWQATSSKLHNKDKDKEINLEKGTDQERILASRTASSASDSTIVTMGTLDNQLVPGDNLGTTTWSSTSRWYTDHQPNCPQHIRSREPFPKTIDTRFGSGLGPKYNIKTPLLRPNIAASNINYSGSRRDMKSAMQSTLQENTSGQQNQRLHPYQHPGYRIHTPKTAPLVRLSDRLRTPTWTSSHQAYGPRTATIPRTPRGNHQDGHMHW